jgi:hypothetical protein
MKPSTKPENEGSLEGVFTTVLNKFQMNLQICLPCVVTKVDRDKNRVSVLPLIDILLTDGTTMRRAEVFNIPIKNASAGGFIINFPVKVGDYGWLRTCDRDITLFKQNYKQAKPNTRRKNSFEDAVYEPDTINHNNFTINDEDADNLVIQSYDNSVKVTLSEDSIKLKATNEITVDAPTINEISTTHNIETSSLNITASSTTFTGGTIKHDGTSIDKTHIHSQAPDSAGNTQVDTTPPSN